MRKRVSKEELEAQRSDLTRSIIEDNLWNFLNSAPFEKVVAHLAKKDSWSRDLFVGGRLERVAEPYMFPLLAPEMSAKFISEFNSFEAEKERTKAVSGMLSIRYLNEKRVIETAERLETVLGMKGDKVEEIAARGNIEEAMELAMRPDPRVRSGIGYLGDYLMRCVKDPKGYKSLEALAKLLKERDRPEDGRGGELSKKGELWRNFCQLFVNKRTLPNWTELRESMLLVEPSDKADVSKWARGLGLSGIPGFPVGRGVRDEM